MFPARRAPTFLIWTVPFTHRSSGVRALFRLCHHLNARGHRAAMAPAIADPRALKAYALRAWLNRLGLSALAGVAPDGLPPRGWRTPIHDGPVGDAIVIYPEIVTGNPLGARRVIRWALNDPGLIGGETHYPDDDLVFVYDPLKLEVISAIIGRPLGPQHVLWTGLVDPAVIYPDPRVPKTMDCVFTYKGSALRERFPLPAGVEAREIEQITPTAAALGDVLRRTRTLYSYDHYSNILREADICGCDIRTVDAEGRWHDPRGCGCVPNILWYDDLQATYADKFADSRFVERFVAEVRRHWDLGAKDLGH